jgi:hypothetical protein
MSPLTKEIIDKFNKEEDPRILVEVLDSYEHLKQKSQKELQKCWSEITEDEPTEDEVNLYQEYKNSVEEVVPLDSLIDELDIDAGENCVQINK